MNETNQNSSSVSDVDVMSPLSDEYRTTEDVSEDDGEDGVLSGTVNPLPPSSSQGGEPITAEPTVASISRPVRSTRGIFPKRYNDFHLTSLVAAASTSDEPLTYHDAMSSLEKEEWYGAMACEFDSMMKNHVWDLVDRPENANIDKNRWVFKKKYDATGKIARLVAYGYSQKEGIDRLY